MWGGGLARPCVVQSDGFKEECSYQNTRWDRNNGSVGIHSWKYISEVHAHLWQKAGR